MKKVFKLMFAAVIATFSSFAMVSCDDDDVTSTINNITSSGVFNVTFTVDPGTSDSTTVASLFKEQIETINNYSYTTSGSVNQAVAVSGFELAVSQADSYVQSFVNQATEKGITGLTVTATLTNVTTSTVVDTKVWTAETSTTEE